MWVWGSRKWHVSAAECALKVGGNKNIYQATHTQGHARARIITFSASIISGRRTRNPPCFVRQNNEKYTHKHTRKRLISLSERVKRKENLLEAGH